MTNHYDQVEKYPQNSFFTRQLCLPAHLPEDSLIIVIFISSTMILLSISPVLGAQGAGGDRSPPWQRFWYEVSFA